jgi:hypothetical protein
MVTRELKPGERKRATNITLHPDVDNAMSDLAWMRRMSKSALINEVLALWLSAREESNAPVSAIGHSNQEAAGGSRRGNAV